MSLQYECGKERSTWSFQYLTDPNVLGAGTQSADTVGLYTDNRNTDPSVIDASSELFGLNNIIGKCGTVEKNHIHKLQMEQDAHPNHIIHPRVENGINPSDYLAHNHTKMSTQNSNCNEPFYNTLQRNVATIIKPGMMDNMIEEDSMRYGSLSRQNIKDNWKSGCQ